MEIQELQIATHQLKCPHFNDGCCKLVARLARVSLASATTSEAQCNSCVQQPYPMRANRVVLGCAIHARKQLYGRDSIAKRLSTRLQKYISGEVEDGIIEGGKRILRYTTSTAKWVSQGRPIRNDEEVNHILEICTSCKEFNSKICKICGCNVNSRRSGFLNKARRATENCPKGKW